MVWLLGGEKVSGGRSESREPVRKVPGCPREGPKVVYTRGRVVTKERTSEVKRHFGARVNRYC